MRLRRIIGNFLIFFSVSFMIYLSVIMVRRICAVALWRIYVHIFLSELLACSFLLLFSLDIRFNIFTRLKAKTSKLVGWGLRIFVYVMVAVLLFFFGKICIGSTIRTTTPAKNVVVLGLALENGRPTYDFLARVDTAVKYLQENPESTAILTGGNPDGTGKTEAGIMYDYMIERGIPEYRMIREDQADTTRANFRNTAALIDPDDTVVLISSKYHMDRAIQTARREGFTQILRNPAPSSNATFIESVMYEVVAEIGMIFWSAIGE